MMMLEVVESTCLGLYFLLEDLTMVTIPSNPKQTLGNNANLSL